MRRKKLRLLAAPAMPCKRLNGKHGAARGKNDDHTSKIGVHNGSRWIQGDCVWKELRQEFINYRTMFDSRISAGATEKTTKLGHSEYFYVVLRHGRSCQEVCGRYCELANKTTDQLYKVSTPCIDGHQVKEEDLKTVGELSKHLARIGGPDILWSVKKIARAITKMDQSLWLTSCAFDLLHSLHLWIQTILSCGKYCRTMSIGIVSRFWLCKGSWRFKIHSGRNSVRVWKSHICSFKLDVQETNCCFSQFNRIYDHSSWCRFANGRNSRAWSLGFDNWSVTFNIQIENRSSSKYCATCHHVIRQRRNSATHRILSNYRVLILFPQTRSITIKERSCIFLRIMKR